MARCGGGGGGGCGGCGSRVHPRPSAVLAGVTTVDSSRTKIDVDSRIGNILGGSVTRQAGGNGTETTVTIAIWRTSTSTEGDFIDRFDLTIETGGGESGQASFSFCVPLEYSHLTLKAFWFTIRNSTSSTENYRVHFDVSSLEV